VSGNVTPDRYLVDKVTLEIDEKVVSDKGSEFVLNPQTKEMEYRDLPPDQRKVQCLEDREVIELTKICEKMWRPTFSARKTSSIRSPKGSRSLKAFFLFRPVRRPYGQEEEGVGSREKDRLRTLLFERALTPIKVKEVGRILEKHLLINCTLDTKGRRQATQRSAYKGWSPSRPDGCGDLGDPLVPQTSPRTVVGGFRVFPGACVATGKQKPLHCR